MAETVMYGGTVSQKVAEDPTRCVAEVSNSREIGFYQCGNKRGYGPEGVFCRLHLEMAQRPTNDVYVPDAYEGYLRQARHDAERELAQTVYVVGDTGVVQCLALLGRGNWYIYRQSVLHGIGLYTSVISNDRRDGWSVFHDLPAALAAYRDITEADIRSFEGLLSALRANLAWVMHAQEKLMERNDDE